MKTIQVELLNNTVNSVVIKLPERKFPGIVIQGDRLNTLYQRSNKLLQLIPHIDDNELYETATEINEIIEMSWHIYVETLEHYTLELPFVK